MRVLVTGAGSFTARYLLPRLATGSSATEVVLTDLVLPPRPRAAFFAADLTERDATEKLIRHLSPQRVVHLAGVSDPEPDRCFAVNLQGTRHLLEACAGLPAPPLVLVVSSAAVYGLTQPGETPVREEVPLRPVTPYGASKAAAELAALSMHRRGQIPVTIVRPFNLIGRGLPSGLAPSDFVARAHALQQRGGRGEIRTGNLDSRRDFVDVRDAVRAYADLVFREDLAGRVFNVASGRAVPVRYLLERILAAVGVEARITVDAALVRGCEVLEQAGEPSALRGATGWSADIPLETSIADMV